MKEKLNGMSFASKLTLLFVCLLLVLTFVFSVALYQYYYRVFEQNTINSIDMALTANAEKLNVLVDTILSAINQVHDNEGAYRYEDQQNVSSLTELVMNFGTYENDMTLWELSKELKKARQDLDRIFATAFGSVQGESSFALFVPRQRPISKYLVFYMEDLNGIYRSKEMEKELWYREVLEREGDLYWFADNADPNRLYLAKNLRLQEVSNTYGKIWRDIGVIRVSFSVDWLMENMTGSGVTEDMAAFITDCEGNILWNNDAAKARISQEDFSGLYHALEQERSVRYTCGGVRYLLQKNELEQGLQIISAIPFSSIQSSARQMITMIVIVMLALAGLGAVFAAALSRSMVRPIIRLSEQMKSGHLEKTEAYRERRDEIGILYHAYNRQQERIQELFVQVQDSLEKQKRAEIHALQVQMNPHFIYNTLGAISCRALLCGEDEIAEQITALTAIIRYNVKNPDALVPLQTELDIISHYEEIWIKTYEDCLQFRHDITPGCENMQIPKLIIQPLVENAILYGSIAQGEKESLLITAKLTPDGRLRVAVENTGRPAPVDEINQYLRGTRNMNVDKDSFGLRNVYERIQRYFGDRGDLVYRINERNHTEAVVEIQTSDHFEPTRKRDPFLLHQGKEL